ncbi:MAG: RNA polymerase sigma-70 factor [Candidatus Symbiothrix sp.]|jgi:RNA polymerase sigma-70 factor (ECF subfamily)|nr:RNA polymerase sigma-70 factor [Candidatus Symbiothrix sp.]
METNDSFNLNLLKEGSSLAFEKLYDQYSGKLYNFILRISNGNTYLSEELTQRTFVKIWETRQLIASDKSFFSYLCTIAKNMLLNELEHQTVVYIYQEYFKQSGSISDYSTEKEINRKMLEEMIDKLAQQLPPARKRIFLLSKNRGYSIKEIAKELNLAESTVQTQLSKALAFMKAQLAKHYYLIVLVILACIY